MRLVSLVRATALLGAGALVFAGGWFVANSRYGAGEADLVLPQSTFDITRVDVVSEVGVRVQVDGPDGTTVRSGCSGTVTATYVEPSELPAAIDGPLRLFDLDYKPVVLLPVADAPVLTRQLAPGMHGQDVELAQKMLAALGLFEGERDGRFGSATASAVRSLNSTTIGSTSSTLDPCQIVPVDQTLSTLESLAVEAGDSIDPSQVAVLSTGQPTFSILVRPDQLKQLRVGDVVLATETGFSATFGQLPSRPANTTDAPSDEALYRVHLVPEGRPDVLVGSSFGASIQSSTQSALIVPASAVVITGAGQGSVELEDGTQLDVPIAVANGANLEITDNAAEGLRVLVPNALHFTDN